MKKSFYLALILAMLLAAALACNAPQTQTSPTPDLALIVAQTQTAIAVNQFLTATVAPAQSGTAATPTAIQAAPVTSAQPAQPQVTTPPQAAAPATTAPQQPNCSDSAKYVSETIPDASAFAPGQSFMKTWTLQNAGTCTWTPDYALVFIQGEQMKGTSPSPIGKTVAPGQTIQIFLPQTAPDSPGEHQGFWKLQSNTGRQFGLGANAATAFWVKINVIPGAGPALTPTIGPGSSAPNPGVPTWTDSFDSPSSVWYLGVDDNTDYEIKNGNMIMTALKPGPDQWRVAQPSYVQDFLMQANFRTGSACSGKDSYGLIVRAPAQANNIINTGYIFTFSCDGSYRIYRMDKGNYVGIVNWTRTPYVKAGANQDNVMTIQAKGDRFQLLANGQLLNEFSDATYPAGLFGLVVRSESTPNFQALVKEISYWNNPQ